MKFRRTTPRFEPATRNVYDATIDRMARTNNECEGCKNGLFKLVGHANYSLWTVIQWLRKIETDLLHLDLGRPQTQRQRRAVVKHQKTLQTLCDQYSKKEKSLALA